MPPKRATTSSSQVAAVPAPDVDPVSAAPVTSRARAKAKASVALTVPAHGEVDADIPGSDGKPVKPKPRSKSASAAKSAASSEAAAKLPPGLRLIGAHTSIAGGVEESIPRAVACGFTASQIFVKNNKQWFAPDLNPDSVRAYHERREAAGLVVFGHNSYLINLGSPKPDIIDTSVTALSQELIRADALGLPFLVMHPGSCGAGLAEAEGLRKIAAGLDRVIEATPKVKTKLALEITAGQGNSLGHRFEHLATLLQQPYGKARLGVCLDTCHMFAAGYDLRTREAYEATFGQFESIVGAQWLLGFHLNDSKGGLGSRLDRHENLGAGAIGLDPFGWLVSDPRWRDIPKVLETPKSEDMHEDVENIMKLLPWLEKV
ncbi:MAG: deoxyribonuclease IV [Candidatus Methylacidiphilales bacterium]|nr:deoxyribonuclease IV [Candidatus Methylacidiphilales bacterium]